MGNTELDHMDRRDSNGEGITNTSLCPQLSLKPGFLPKLRLLPFQQRVENTALKDDQKLLPT